mgnify:CR=1 FL=1
MSDHSFELKGSLFPLSVLYCQDLSAAAVKTQLQQKLAQAPAFFYRAPVVINVESVTQVPDFEAIAQVFEELELVLVGVCGASAEMKKLAQAAGLASLQLSKSKTPAKETKEKEVKAEVAVAAPVMETKVVEVKYKVSKTDVATLQKVLNLAGYDADDQKADAAAQKALPLCCQPGGH